MLLTAEALMALFCNAGRSKQVWSGIASMQQQQQQQRKRQRQGQLWLTVQELQLSVGVTSSAKQQA